MEVVGTTTPSNSIVTNKTPSRMGQWSTGWVKIVTMNILSHSIVADTYSRMVEYFGIMPWQAIHPSTVEIQHGFERWLALPL